MTNEEKRKNVWLELLRFIVCGFVAALTDYLVAQSIILAFSGSLVNKTAVIAISTAVGFAVSVVVNYLISTFWVYQNVEDKSKTKTPKFITLFVILSLVAMFLSIGAMLLCNLISEAAFSINVADASFIDLIKNMGWGFLSSTIFWAYAISFVIKTLVGLIFNYFTRKYLLYKAPKEQK